jgi:hypothetical protein
MTDEWVYFSPDRTIVYEITNFDDGNYKYRKYVNQWYIIGRWFGKIAIINAGDPNIRIDSISAWKTDKLANVFAGSGKRIHNENDEYS